MPNRCAGAIQTQQIACALQLRSSVVGQVNEAEAEVEEARAQAEQEKQQRRAHMETLLAEKAGLEAELQQQRQLSRQLKVCPEKQKKRNDNTARVSLI